MIDSVSFDRKLEQRLRRTETLSDAQLASARKYQEESAIGLAEALVEFEFLSSGEVEHIVSSLNEIRSVKLEELQVDLDAVKHVPRHVAISCKCIPIRRSGNALVVAVSDSDTDKVREELRVVTDFEIVLLMAEHDALEHALFIYYGKDAEKTGENSGVLRGTRKLRRIPGRSSQLGTALLKTLSSMTALHAQKWSQSKLRLARGSHLMRR